MDNTITGFAHLDKIADEIGDEAGTCDADYAFQKAAALMIYNLRTALETAEARAEKAETDKAALEEDLEELLSGLKLRFPVQYADLEGDEYGDDAFSSHDLFDLVIDPAVNAAQKAEAERDRLQKMVEWLANKLIDCPPEFTNCAVDCAECRIETARRAVGGER